MSSSAIQVENLFKRYTIGSGERYGNLRESIASMMRRPLDAFLSRARRRTTPAVEPERKTIFALNDVSFKVQQGDVIGIIGRNGAGKSTLLKILSRITSPTGGSIEVVGRVGSLLEVGTGFHPELTGRENIFLNGAILGMNRSEIARKFDDIVQFSEIESHIDTPVKRYSSGMYMRLAFAVAAHLEPEILVVDEVLAVGDAAFQKKCLGQMSEVARAGRTVLFVSHNMAAVSSLCKRTIVLSGGKVAFDGDTSGGIGVYLRSLRDDTSGNLRDRLRRDGAGRVQFTQVRLLDADRRPADTGMSGKPLTVALDYEARDGKPISNIRASLLITDRLGQTLFLCSTELTSTRTLSGAASGTLECTISRLPLSGSEYILSPFLEVNGDIEDFVDGAATLTVEDGDFYGSGKLYPPGWQGKGVLVPHSWAVVSH